MGHVIDYPLLFTGETIFCDFPFVLQCTKSFRKIVYSKRKEFDAPMGYGSKFFPFRVDPFLEMRLNSLAELPPMNMHLFLINVSIFRSVLRVLKFKFDLLIQNVYCTYVC